MARLSAFPRFFALVASVLLALGAGNAFAQAAYVHDMTGTATATTGTGAGATQRALKIGDTVETGSTISTGDKSTAVVKFEDGQVMALAEKTSFRIVDYKFNKQRVAQSSAVFTLLQGGLRFISGVMGATNRNSFRMNVGTATIGIRGSDGVIQYDSVSQAVVVAVLAGALSLNTAQGAQLISPGNFSTVTPGQPVPTVPQLTAQATAAVQSAVGNLRQQIVPANAQVVVQAAAAAAVAVANAVTLQNQAKADPNNAALQTAAANATKAAQDSLAAAIKAGQDAFQQAVKEGGAVQAAPPAPPLLPQGVTGTTSDPAINIDGTTITPTPAGGAGSGGGGTATPASGS